MNGLIANRHAVAIFCLIALVVGFSAAFEHYRNEATRQAQRANTAEQQLRQANSTINDIQGRQRAVAALDEKYTRELADAKNTIERLRNDVAAGRKRLRIAATCPAVRDASSTSGGTDATSARPTDAAERNYFILRERIETATAQIAGLQDYIRQQCLAPQHTALQ